MKQELTTIDLFKLEMLPRWPTEGIKANMNYFSLQAVFEVYDWHNKLIFPCSAIVEDRTV